MTGDAARIRLDKWLWHARFFKTRTLAARQVSAGHVRVNGNRVSKPAHAVGPQDVLTFVQGDSVRVLRILGPGTRRGPAPEAQTLYEDIGEPAPKTIAAPSVPKYHGKGRPTKRDRRKLDLDRRGALE